MSAYRIVIGLMIACFISIATPTHAETITNCDFESLKSVVNRLNQADDGGEIDFACAGTIRFTETLFITSAITINGHDDLIFDGYGLYTLFEVEGSLTLNGVIIQKGWTAIRNYGELFIRDSTLRDNLAYQFGAGLANYGIATLIDSTFSGNQANTGGAIYNEMTGYLTIGYSTFSGNQADSQGGVIKNVGYIIIYSSTFTDNRAGAYGAAVMDNVGSADIENSTFTHNGAPNYRGEIIYNTNNLAVRRSAFEDNFGQVIDSSGNLALSNSRLINNDGGAVLVGADATIHNNRFQGNHSNLGGAINIWKMWSSETFPHIVISNNTFIENSAEREGGAIAYQSKVKVSIINNTFLNNRAGEGGAIYSTVYAEINPVATIQHNTFVDNAGIGGAIFTDSRADVQYNIFSGATRYKSQCSGAGAGQIDDTNLTDYQCGDAVRVDDLMLGEFDGVFPLLAGSPAIDAYPAPCLVQRDKRGVIRSSACDIGAVEWSPNGDPIIYNRYIAVSNCTWDAFVDAVNLMNWLGGDIALVCPPDTIISFDSALTINTNLTITSLTPIQFVGNYDTSLFTTTPTASLTLRGIHISGGNSVNGGAIYNEGMLTLRNMTFSNNHAQWGGAVYNAGMMTVINTQFKENRAEAGGAIFNETALAVMSSTFWGNSAVVFKSDVMKPSEIAPYTSASGGAIYNHHSLIIANSQFELNQAERHGGAVINDDVSEMVVIQSQFLGNTAGSGGALYYEFNYDYMPLGYNPKSSIIAKPMLLRMTPSHWIIPTYVLNSQFEGNIATKAGGGAIASGTQIAIAGSLFVRNQAIGYGGAIDTFDYADKAIYQNTFIENRAEIGGAISITQWAYIFMNTFVRNEATISDGAMYGNGGENNTFIHNTAPENPTGDTTRIDTSIIIEGDGACAEIRILTDNRSEFTNLVNVPCENREPDLLLGEFNGWVVPLLAGNMAIDQYACDENYYESDYDQLGTQRPQGELCDLGAVEFVPDAP